MSRLGAIIEQAADRGDPETAGAALHDLRDYFDRLVIIFGDCPEEDWGEAPL